MKLILETEIEMFCGSPSLNYAEVYIWQWPERALIWRPISLVYLYVSGSIGAVHKILLKVILLSAGTPCLLPWLLVST